MSGSGSPVERRLRIPTNSPCSLTPSHVPPAKRSFPAKIWGSVRSQGWRLCRTVKMFIAVGCDDVRGSGQPFESTALTCTHLSFTESVKVLQTCLPKADCCEKMFVLASNSWRGGICFSQWMMLSRAWGTQSYICNKNVATVVYLGTQLQKPILVEGPAGVGKTELGKVLAYKCPGDGADQAPVL